MDKLRLDAVDADDLAILSAHCQDAVTTPADIAFEPGARRFVVAMNRFVWEQAGAPPRLKLFRRPAYERRRAVLHFERVVSAERSGMGGGRGTVLALLAIRFAPADAPSGAIELVFAGGAAIRLGVECIEARLTDLDAAWTTPARPDHEGPDAAGGAARRA